MSTKSAWENVYVHVNSTVRTTTTFCSILVHLSAAYWTQIHNPINKVVRFSSFSFTQRSKVLNRSVHKFCRNYGWSNETNSSVPLTGHWKVCLKWFDRILTLFYCRNIVLYQIQSSTFVYARTLCRGTIPREYVRFGSQPCRTEDISVSSRLQFGHHGPNHVESNNQLSSFRFCALQVSIEWKIGKLLRFSIEYNVMCW